MCVFDGVVKLHDEVDVLSIVTKFSRSEAVRVSLELNDDLKLH